MAQLVIILTMNRKKLRTMKAIRNKISRITKISILSLATILISSGMNGQKSLKSFELNDLTGNLFSTTEEIITAMKEVKEKKAFYEEDILLEEWMADLDYWAKSHDSASSANEVTSGSGNLGTESEIMEENLELEDWMLNYNWIEHENFDEQELKLEGWMKNPENWNIYACSK